MILAVDYQLTTLISFMFCSIVAIRCGIYENMALFIPIFNQELEEGKLMAATDLPK